MKKITWFTQPQKSFASLYMYDPETKVFRRARMELGRTGNNPDPGIFRNENRVMVFITRKIKEKFAITSVEPQLWKYEKGKVNYNGIDLSAYQSLPEENISNYFIYDFSYDSEGKTTFVHKGNHLTQKPKLPDNKTHVIAVINNLISKHEKEHKIPFGNITATSKPEDMVKYFEDYKITELVS